MNFTFSQLVSLENTLGFWSGLYWVMNTFEIRYLINTESSRPGIIHIAQLVGLWSFSHWPSVFSVCPSWMNILCQTRSWGDCLCGLLYLVTFTITFQSFLAEIQKYSRFWFIDFNKFWSLLAKWFQLLFFKNFKLHWSIDWWGAMHVAQWEVKEQRVGIFYYMALGLELRCSVLVAKSLYLLCSLDGSRTAWSSHKDR